MLYRVFTEDINTKDIHRLASELFDGFTSYKATGYWQGTPEASRVIEVVSEKDIYNDVKTLAQRIKDNNQQQAVLIQTLNNRSYFV